MGNRHFYDQMLQDTIRHQQAAIVDEVDVTTLKDYMQVTSRFACRCAGKPRCTDHINTEGMLLKDCMQVPSHIACHHAVKPRWFDHINTKGMTRKDYTQVPSHFACHCAVKPR